MSSAKQKSEPVLIFTHEFYPKNAGISVVVQELAHGAQQSSMAVEVFAPESPSIDEATFPYPVHALKNKGTHNWRCLIATARKLFSLRDKLKISKVCLAEPGPILAAMYLNLFVKIQSKQLILVLHGSEIIQFSKNPILSWLFNKLLKQTDRVVVLSNYCKNLLIKAFPASQEIGSVIPGALKHNFAPVKSSASLISQKVVNLLTVARIHPRKGQIQVLEALSLLPESLKKQIIYNLVGPIIDPKYFQKIELFANEHAIQLNYLGEVSDADLPRTYNSADIFLMTSIPYKNSIEGFGLTYLEASASGLAVIAYNSGGVSDAVQENKTGLLVQPGDVEGLSIAILKLLNNLELRESMGQAGIEFSQQFSWQKNAEIIFS